MRLTKSQTCQPSGSSSAVSAMAPSSTARRFPFDLLAFPASGQQTRLHTCRPHPLRALQAFWHSISRPSAISVQGTCEVVSPHRHLTATGNVHGGHCPIWHVLVHECAQVEYGLPHGWAQVGMGSMQLDRGAGRGDLVQGHVVTRDGENGQRAGVVEGGWHA